jgi:hypothetical protein
MECDRKSYVIIFSIFQDDCLNSNRALMVQSNREETLNVNVTIK